MPAWPRGRCASCVPARAVTVREAQAPKTWKSLESYGPPRSPVGTAASSTDRLPGRPRHRWPPAAPPVALAVGSWCPALAHLTAQERDAQGGQATRLSSHGPGERARAQAPGYVDGGRWRSCSSQLACASVGGAEALAAGGPTPDLQLCSVPTRRVRPTHALAPAPHALSGEKTRSPPCTRSHEPVSPRAAPLSFSL